MPSSILSHQAPVLPLKIKYPHKFDGTALCLSTFLPDLNVIFEPFFPYSFRDITHSLFGLIIWTLPLTIIMTIIFSKYLSSFLANIAKNSRILTYFGIDQLGYLKEKRYNRKFFKIAFYSAIIGGLTHLLLDLPSHENIELFWPWVIFQSPDFLLYSIIDFGSVEVGLSQIDANLTIYQLIWIAETFIGLIIALYFFRYIKKHNLISKWYQEVQ